MVTATTDVNVRTGPGTSYRVLGTIETGQSLPVKGSGKAGWTQVSYSGQTAWISSDYVVESSDDDDAPAAKPSKGWRYGTTALNVRTGPSLTAAVVTVAGKGYGFQVTGTTRNGYTEVNFKGRARWVTSQYLSEKKPGEAASTAGWRYATTALNVRTEPTGSARVVDVAGKGYGFKFHGTTRNGYAEVTFQGSTRWVSARYLSRTKPSSGSSSGSSGSGSSTAKETWRYSTVALNVRTGPSLGAGVVDVAARGYGFLFDGTTRNGYAEVTFQGKKRWVSQQYLSTSKPGVAGPSGSTALPKVVGYRYATTALDIRSASKNSTTYSEVPRGTKLAITGVKADGRAQIVYNGAVRWVTARYLSTKAPSSGAGGSGGGQTVTLPGLTANSRYLLARLQARFPQITTYYGVRADPIPDHPSGRAVDAMLPNYTSASSQALGKEMAEWIKANAGELKVEYIIFDQRIWNVRRAGEGWRYMADRGSDNANHKNHVHITTL
nr:SH3 domain-containing protein [Auraticoccus cholistanensis]